MDEARMREIAREEIASLAALALRRLQEHRSGQDEMSWDGFWGEALRDFGGSHEPGPAPDEETV